MISLLLLFLPLLLLLLQSVVASQGPIDGQVFLQALEELENDSLGVTQIQVQWLIY